MVFCLAIYDGTLSWSDTNQENTERHQLIDGANPKAADQRCSLNASRIQNGTQ